jgi:hypothetical protein
VDCVHVIDPLPIKHVAVDDSCIASVSYDRYIGRLEVATPNTFPKPFWGQVDERSSRLLAELRIDFNRLPRCWTMFIL